MKPIFHDGKKNYINNKKIQTKQNNLYQFTMYKINKNNFEKQINRGKYCSNPQCFMKKTTILSPVKSTEIIKKKTMQENTITIHSVL